MTVVAETLVYRPQPDTSRLPRLVAVQTGGQKGRRGPPEADPAANNHQRTDV